MWQSFNCEQIILAMNHKNTYEQELILSLEHLCSLKLSTSLSDTAMSLAASLPALATLRALTGDPAANACSSSITTGTARLFESYDMALIALIIFPLSVKLWKVFHYRLHYCYCLFYFKGCVCSHLKWRWGRGDYTLIWVFCVASQYIEITLDIFENR